MSFLDECIKRRRAQVQKLKTEKLDVKEYGSIKDLGGFTPQNSFGGTPGALTFKKWEAHEYQILKPRLKPLKIKLGKKLISGSCIDLYRPSALEKIYHRSPLCLKVFKLSKSIWGFPNSANPSSIISSTIAQNLLWLNSNSPRVYDLVSVKNKTAQVCDYAGGKYKQIKVSDPRLVLDERVWGGKENFVGDKFVDFEGTYLRDYKKYRGEVLREIARVNELNGHCEGMYQSVYSAPGIRDTEARIKAYGLADLEGKSVLDIGCSNGMFCRSACDLGASRVVGLEYANMAILAQTLAFLDGYFNIDFYGADLKTMTQRELVELTGIKKFDVHLFLAMENHVGWHDWVKNCDTLYYESHGQPRHWRVIDSVKGMIRSGFYKD